jgi:hypothetical protein
MPLSLLGLSQLVRTAAQQFQAEAAGDGHRTERYEHGVGREGLPV